jgi:hypothetical protein
MRRILMVAAVMTMFLMTQGCARFLTIGHEDFACKGNSKGGSCQDPLTIYKQRHELLKAQAGEKKDVKKESETTTSLADEGHAQNTIPVRQTEEVRRVYVNGFEDRNGNLIGDFWGYVVVRGGKWLTLDGRRLRNAENKKK